MQRKIEFLFDDDFLRKISDGMNGFEKRLFALKCEGRSDRKIAKELNVSHSALCYRKKKKMLDISHEIRKYDNLPATYKKIDALLMDCLEKGYISLQRKINGPTGLFPRSNNRNYN